MTAPTDNADILDFAKAAEKRAKETQGSRWEADFPDDDSYQFTIYDAADPLTEIAQCVSVHDAQFIEASKFDVPTLARMVVRMHEALEGIASGEDVSPQRTARYALGDLIAELKGSQERDR